MAKHNANPTQPRSAALDESAVERRSRTMRAVRSYDTAPEMAVRKLLRQLGFMGYRLHRKELPGKPDVVFIGRRKAIFVHGCFWHGHDCLRGNRMPTTNADYWHHKIERNKTRDVRHLAELTRCRWSILTIWECELRAPELLAGKITEFMRSNDLASR